MDSDTQIWQPQPGPQTAMCVTDADEILGGGARMGGKTIGGILWLGKGNHHLDISHPAYKTALAYPRYRALVVRLHAQDLREWIDQAYEIYKDTGVQVIGNPRVLYWPQWGSKIYIDHLNDEKAFSKYKGWNINRILVEELTEIPQQGWYLRLLGSLRSRKEADGSRVIRPQILSTTNPDGPGHMWVKKRFVELYTTKTSKAIQWNGETFAPADIKPGLIPPGTKVIDPVSKLTRIFIPATIDDNKFAGEEYQRNLVAQTADSEALYQAWRYGRWDVFSGQFFDSLRFEGPMPGEETKKYPWADHSYDEKDVRLEPWWPETIGCDWGYNHEAATYWGRYNQVDKRMYVFRESVVRQVGSRELGQNIAKMTLPDLLAMGENAHIPLFLSHDAFSKEDDTKTRAELFVTGIEDVLGTDSAYLAELTDEEKRMDPAASYDSMIARFTNKSKGLFITVHKARQDRAAMAAYVRELLRWKVPDEVEPDIDFARRLLLDPSGDGHVLYENYMAKFRLREKEYLPKVKFERKLARIRGCMATLQYDPKNTEVPLKVDSQPNGDPGDDPYDGFCHLVIGARVSANRKPRKVFFDERLERLRQQYGPNPDPALVGQVLIRAQQDWDKEPKSGWMNLRRM